MRKFSDRPVEPEVVSRILRAGQVSPTACNYQPQHILVINSPDALEKLRKCTTSHFGCTLAMLVCSEVDKCWARPIDGKCSSDVDASIVTTQMMLEAAALGVGTTWVMYFSNEAIREEFALPEGYEPVSLLVMGYPADTAKPAPGHAEIKPLSQTVFFNSFDCPAED